jgi:predicted Zn-dependent protease
MILQKEECKKIFDKVFKTTKADAAEASIDGGIRAGSRYARNGMTTNVVEENFVLSVSVRSGKKEGAAFINQFDDASIERVVKNAEEIAGFSPDNEELMPLVKPPQTYPPIKAYFENTANFSPKEMAEKIRASIDMVEKDGLIGSGYMPKYNWVDAMANSEGLFSYHPWSGIGFLLTVRSPDGTGSGWARDQGVRRVEELAVEDKTRIACEKCLRSRNPVSLEPGDYTVVMESAGVARFLALMMGAFDARAAYEGRSFMSLEKGKTKLGQKILGDNITISSQHDHPQILGSPIGPDGLPAKNVTWVKDGVITNLSFDRYWAQKQNKEVTGFPINLVMEGEDHSLDELIASTERGILITRFWYIRTVDPMKILNTGLTRDGLFLIEKGKITRPLVNFRFNESPAVLFSNVKMMTRPERAMLYESFGDFGTALVPAIKADNFTMSSIAPAV